MKPAEAAAQASQLASLREHPGYKIIGEMFSKAIVRNQKALTDTNFSDLLAVGRCQGEIKAINDLLNTVNSIIRNAPKEVSEDA